MKLVAKLDDWHKTRTGYAVFAIVELAAVYVLGSLALDSGHLWQYGFAVLFLIGAVNNIVKFFKKLRDGKQ